MKNGTILPMTLLQLSNADLSPANLETASLVLIDFQLEYLNGPIAIPTAHSAIVQAERLLKVARQLGTPIFHIAHKGRPGSMFDRTAERGQIVSELNPLSDEIVVEKSLPNAFAGTCLHDLLGKVGRRDILLAGFMTHMCVSSTARAALDLGYRVTIDQEACASRDLPDGRGGIISAGLVHEVALAELADRFAIVSPVSQGLG